MDLFKNMVMGLGLVQLISWAFGILLVALVFGTMSAGGGLFGGDAIGEIGRDMKDQYERRKTEEWYRSSGSGEVPYYGDRDYKASKQRMGDPTLDLRDDSSRYNRY